MLLFALAAGGLWAQPAAAALEGAGGSAVYLLRQGITVSRDGEHNRLLRALRHLHDPALAPLYAHLAQAEHPILKIHGFLGLAEVSPAGQLDLRHVAELKDAAVQAQLVSAALDADLLGHDEAAQLLAWPGLDEGVKLMIATHLVEAGRFNDLTLLREAQASSRLARRSLASLLLLQLDDPAGVEGLQALNSADDADRDVTRAMLLETALRHNFHRAGTWAYAIATEQGGNPVLGLLALRTALRFGDPRAPQLWQQQFTSTTDLAQRIRLALSALQMAPWLTAEPFEVLIATGDPLFQQMGRVGQSIALGRHDVPDQVVALILLHYPLANSWALSYARHHAEPIDAQLILLGLISASEEGPEQTRTQRFDDAMEAAELLYNQAPDAAVNLLRPILASPQTNPRLVQAILLGLVRAKLGNAHEVVAGLPEFTNTDSRHLTLLLLAKHDQPLSDRQMNQLALMAQGGSGLPSTLRIQAAWSWLKRTGQVDAALREVLARR